MPVIEVSSFIDSRIENKKYIDSVIGVSTPYVSTDEHPRYIKDYKDYLSQVGANPNAYLDKVLLDAGYGLQILASKVTNVDHYKTLRIFTNGKYCHPEKDAERYEDSGKEVPDFEDLLHNTSSTFAITLPLIDFLPNDYILLSNGFSSILLWWGTPSQIIPPISISNAYLIHKVLSTDDLIDFLTLLAGFRVNRYEKVLVLSKSTLFDPSFTTNIRLNSLGFNISPSINGCSDIVNSFLEPSIDIVSKYSRFSDDVKVKITHLFSTTYSLSVFINEILFEKYDIQFTETDIIRVNSSSDIIEISLFKPIAIEGTFPLQRDFHEEIQEIVNTTSVFENPDIYPAVDCVISTNMDIDSEKVLCIDSNKDVDWMSNIIKHKSKILLSNGEFYPSEHIFLSHFRFGGLFTSLDALKVEDDQPEKDYNRIKDYSYSLDILKWIYKPNNIVTAVSRPLTITIIENSLKNNLKFIAGNSDVIRRNVKSVMENLEWLSDLAGYSIVSIIQVNKSAKVNIELYLDSYLGTEETIMLTVEIKGVK